MNQNNELNGKGRSFVSRVRKSERGQIFPLVAVMMGTFFCMCGYVIDAGRVYLSYQQLQASTDAAALAGGQALGLGTNTPSAAATQYSSTSGGVNTAGVMTGVTMTPTLKCLSTLVAQGIPCFGGGSYNAIQVSQTGVVPMTFARFFGTSQVSLTATATAAMAGAATTPYNVAIIVDSTASMNDTDSGSNCNSSRITCALNGVNTLLGELYPCASSVKTCSVSGGVASNAVDQVALFTFPNMTTTTTSNDTTCATTAPTTNNVNTFASSTLNTTTGTATIPFTTTTTTGTGKNQKTTTTTVQMTYQVTNGLGTNGFLSDYRASDTSGSLNTSSPLSMATGYGSCTGISAPGGAGTFYASVIYQAANSLLGLQASELPLQTQNVIILVSDGDASASQAQMVGGSGAPGTSTLLATAGTSGTYPSYPSWNNQCAQAIQAAQAAAAQGIRFYSVAYGAESSGCNTDTSGTYKNITPCQTMKDMASSAAYFYSDYASSGSGVDKTCAGSGASTTSINQIFTDIFTSFTVARLIPNSTT
jgi:hypothetical protein